MPEPGGTEITELVKLPGCHMILEYEPAAVRVMLFTAHTELALMARTGGATRFVNVICT